MAKPTLKSLVPINDPKDSSDKMEIVKKSTGENVENEENEDFKPAPTKKLTLMRVL